jgi:hypothetical protein
LSIAAGDMVSMLNQGVIDLLKTVCEIEFGEDTPRPFQPCNMVRCIFGNPFRSIDVDSRWRTSTVVDLATAIYEERQFQNLPILADALMDAGCDSQELIKHCRDDGPHVLGCWPVDLILGKSEPPYSDSFARL